MRRTGATPHELRTLLVLGALLAVAVVSGVARAGQPARGSSAVVPRPRIVWDPIPFGPKRKAEMTAYARRHYGSFLRPTWRLNDPHVIVIHYTETPNFSSTFNTFAADVPDPELHELPGTCAHFVIDRAGTIHQLVALGTMCRHTVGLELDRDRDRARRLQRRPGPRKPEAAHGQLAPGAVAALPLSHPGQERHRAQREPGQSLPPRGCSGVAQPDARGLQPRRHEDLPPPTPAYRRLQRAVRSPPCQSP